MDGGYGNKIRENSLINHTALLMYSSSTVCSYNTISNNDFPAQVNPNLLTLHYASTVRPIGNRFINNEGVNWYDDLNIYTSNVFQTHGTNYGVNPSVQNVTDSIATYTPNFKPKTGTEYATNGEQPSRIIYITVKQNLTITIPTNYYSWETITFVIKQDSIGGHSVGFSGYINSWTNVGNSAGKVSTIQFLMNDVGEGIQVGSQSPWM
jgi:hypothetical protein